MAAEKKMLLFDEDGVDEADASNLTINDEYARRYEHNKRREERQRCPFSYICRVSNSH